jgi:hypothetical protein
MKLFKYILLLYLLCSCYINSALAQFETVCARYDILSTLAGKGEVGTGGFNHWKMEYEGASALIVELSRPHIAMADKAGNIYIADKEAHAIRKVSSDGILTTVAGTNVGGYNGDGPATECQLYLPNGLWVQEDGSFYILDLSNGMIRRVDTNGLLTTVIDDTNGIAIGRGLWVNNTGDLIYYASNSRVMKWTPAGGLEEYATGFTSLGNIVVDPQGFLVATDRIGDRVYRIREDGSKEVIAGNGTAAGGGDGYQATETGLDGVRGVWFLTDGSYFLATHSGSQIWYVDTQGMIHLFLDGKEGDEYHSGDGEHFRTPGYKISEARAITMDYQGNILITENDAGFIRKISLKISAIEDDSAQPGFILRPAYPNPFNSSTLITYRLLQPGSVHIGIFDLLGRKITTLVNEKQSGGNHQASWDGRDLMGKTVASGLYLYRIDIGKARKFGKVFYLK